MGTPGLARRFGSAAMLAALVLLASVAQVRGQALYGSILGTVSDTSGLSVPGATVTITQVETNRVRTAISTENGGYTLADVPAGTYRVDVALEGFQTFHATNVIVRVNAAVRVDARLAVGGLEETVVVLGTAALLQTETAALQAERTSAELENLPINGRSFHSLLTLAPGVQQPEYFQAGGINNPSRAMSISINGNNPNDVVFRLDGVSATNQWMQRLQAYTPAVEAIESVSVVTSSFDAEQGMAGGASVNVTIKTGSNIKHGSAFEYNTNKALRDKNYFILRGQPKYPDTKDVFGGTFSGPLKRDRLFYFLSVESTLSRATGNPYARESTVTGLSLLTLPQADIRSGNFANTGTVIYDPATGTSNGQNRIPFAFENCPGLTSTGDPGFKACNYIPADRFSTVAKNMLAWLPLPQISTTTNNYLTEQPYDSYYTKLDTKFTVNASPRLNLNGRISYLPDKERAKGMFAPYDQLNPLSPGTNLDSKVFSTALSATRTVSPNFLIDGVFGFTYQHTYQYPPGGKPLSGVCYGAQVGIPNACQPPLQRDYATPRTAPDGWSSWGNGLRSSNNFGSVFDYLEPQWQFVVNGNWNRGAHNVKFGTDWQILQMNHYETLAPYFIFTGGATALNGGSSPNLYNSFADFLLGLPQNYLTALQNPLITTANGGSQDRSETLRTKQGGIYLRDQWELGRHITLSGGLRWEYYPVSNHVDRGMEIFDFTTMKIVLCGLGGNPKDCGVKAKKDMVVPRVGIAYRANDKTVFRAGLSRAPQNDNMGQMLMRNFPVIFQYNPQGATSYTPVSRLDDGFPLLPILDVSQPTMTMPSNVQQWTNVPGTFERGMVTSFNVAAQRSFRWGFTGQIAYVGNRQKHMMKAVNVNYGLVGGGTASEPLNQAGLPNGFKTTAAMNEIMPVGRVQYDSLQTTLSRRMTNGVAINAAYTYCRNIDWWAGSIPIPDYWSLNKGPATTSVPHKFDLSASVELPLGPGHRFLADGALGSVAGGWQLNMYFTAYSGVPFNVTAAGSSLNAPGSTQLADQIKPASILKGIGPTTPWFDVTAFKPVTTARFGNYQVNSLRGPGYNNMDASLFRTFKLGSSANLQFRAEAFNITNTPHFSNPSGLNASSMVLNADGTVANLNGFGVISSTNAAGREYDERFLRLGVRLSF
jgi:hypothetical protein